jgi:hypothetical protein
MIVYNNNHIVDRFTGRIIKRDYSYYKVIECSCCHNPIIGKPAFISKESFSKTEKKIAKVLNIKLTKTINYCIDCKVKFDKAVYKLENKKQIKKHERTNKRIKS